MQTKKWFINRIGKKIFRDDSCCKCIHCKNILKNGVTIADDLHADYLYEAQNDYYGEGILINYRDKKLCKTL